MVRSIDQLLAYCSNTTLGGTVVASGKISGAPGPHTPERGPTAAFCYKYTQPSDQRLFNLTLLK